MSPLVSNSRCKQHSSIILETSIKKILLFILNNPIISAFQSDTTGKDQRSIRPVNTLTINIICLDTLADSGRQQSIYQQSLIAETTVAQSMPTQS